MSTVNIPKYHCCLVGKKKVPFAVPLGNLHITLGAIYIFNTSVKWKVMPIYSIFPRQQKYAGR